MQKYMIDRQAEIYIYGAGRVGRLMENLLVANGCRITAFIDENAANRHYKDYKIMAPDDFENTEDAVIIIALAAENIAKSVKASLEAVGCQNVIIYSDRRIQEQFCLHNKGGECLQCVFTAACQLEKVEDTHKVHIDELSIGLTTKCSLNCKNCVALTPRLKQKNIMNDMKADDFKKALGVLEQHIDSINEFVLGGGDPLLYKNISEIIEIILGSAIKFRQIRILTPGIVPIQKELMDWLKHNKIKITIDDYGNKLNEKQRLSLQCNLDNLEKNGCNYEILDNTEGIWYDYGNFEDRKLSESEVAERFNKCSMKACIGLTPACYLGRCTRYMVWISAFGNISGEEKKEYIDLLNDGDMVKEKLTELLRAKTLRACNYCNGCDTDNVVSAGEQI